MKVYVLITGALFGALTVAHLWRMTLERPLATEPWSVAITAASAIMCLWAARLLWRSSRP
jgi:hypothetical protein